MKAADSRPAAVHTRRLIPIVTLALLAPLPWVCTARPALAATPQVAVEFLEDGTELIVAPIAGADRVSFRYLVHTGSAADPHNQEGLAHLLEHLVFHGNISVDQRTLFDRARELGANLNAFTSAEHTSYVLDGPPSVVEALLPAYLGVITSPVLSPRGLMVERGVVGAEATLRPDQGLDRLLSDLVLPGLRPRGGVIGTTASRQRIERDDLAAFFATHYVAANTTIIFTGAIDAARARKIVEESSRLAPDPPCAAGRDKCAVPESEDRGISSTPVEGKVKAPLSAALYGYDLDGVDRSTCRDLAELIEHRLRVVLWFKQPLASQLFASCLMLNGHQLLIALVSNRSYVGEDLNDAIREEYEAAKSRSITPAERAHLLGRAKTVLSARLHDPAALADALVTELSGGPARADRSPVLRAILSMPSFDGAAMRRAAERCFVDDRRIVLEVSPL